MKSPFHEGELELQRRAGSLEAAGAVGRIVRSQLPPGAGRFLARQRFGVASSLEPGGRVWASLLTGPEGFIGVVDPQMLRLAAAPVTGDPLVENLAARPELGLLVLDPRTRQRLRFNGRGLLRPEGLFLVVQQAYGNCPKYIQRREPEPDGEGPAPGDPRVSRRLDARQQAWLRAADTFFIASFHPAGGADASHRGGFPGFVRVPGSDLVEFDDYPGNGMFNTLGNLLAYPPAGLLLAHFASGDLLQLSGHTEVDAEFRVRFQVESVRETRGASPLRFRFLEYSPANPPSRPAPRGISRELEGFRQGGTGWESRSPATTW